MLLNSFYFLLGLGARMQDVVKLGAPIAGLFVTLLSSHLLLLLVGSALWNEGVHLILHGSDRRRDCTASEGFYIDVDTLLIARYGLEPYVDVVKMNISSYYLSQQCVCGWSVYCGQHGWSTPVSTTGPDDFCQRRRSSRIPHGNAGWAGTVSTYYTESTMTAA